MSVRSSKPGTDCQALGSNSSETIGSSIGIVDAAHHDPRGRGQPSRRPVPRRREPHLADRVVSLAVGLVVAARGLWWCARRWQAGALGLVSAGMAVAAVIVVRGPRRAPERARRPVVAAL
jgi:hypothetical protein